MISFTTSLQQSTIGKKIIKTIYTKVCYILQLQLFYQMLFGKKTKSINTPLEQQRYIYARLDDGNGVKILFDPQQTFDSLIARIRKSPLLLPEQFTLRYCGKQLKDYDKTLKESKVKDKSIIHVQNLTPCSIKQINIDICIYFKQETIIIKNKIHDTVATLKRKIWEKLDIHPSHQILIFRGKSLDISKTLQHYHIRPSSLICLLSNFQTKQPETVWFKRVDFQAPKQITNSLKLSQRKSSKEMFRSNFFEDRPVAEIQIKSRDNFPESPSKQFGKEFNFDQFYPKISELCIEQRNSHSIDFSLDSYNFDSQSSHSVSLNYSPSPFRKGGVKMDAF